MTAYREKLKSAFEGLARRLYRHPYISLAIIALVTAGLLAQIPRMRSDMSTESFLAENDPARVAFDDFRRQFGRDELVLILLEPKEVFSADFLGELRRFQQELEQEVPFLHDVPPGFGGIAAPDGGGPGRIGHLRPDGRL